MNDVPTSNRYFIVRESGEPLKMRTQKIALEAGALIDDAKKWKSIDFKPIRRQVRRLQMRIAKPASTWLQAPALKTDLYPKEER